MTLQQKIIDDLKKAMKSKNQEKKSLLRVLIGEMNRQGKELSDDNVLKIIKKMKDNATELSNEKEISILDSYLPKMMDEKEIENLVNNIIKENGFGSMKDMGKVMKEIKSRPDSATIDASFASKKAKELLS